MPHKININISLKKKYAITISKNIWDSFLNHCSASYSLRKIFIVIDENVRNFHGNEIKKQCNSYFNDCHIIEIPAGEKSKSFHHYKNLLDELLEKKIERSTPLLAVGGGVIGDLAGFAAATALRGIPLIHMPTSLLAMVDSSVGGKTGINHSIGKNLIGAFYQPDAVFTHLPFLETLPNQEWVNGLSEMLKYAAISNPGLFEQLEDAVSLGFSPNDQWKQLIYECAKIKSEIVQTDALEAGLRAFLNFGHTFGHALEKVAEFETISHGEAVFTGMLAAVRLSSRLGAPVDTARFHPFKPLYNIELPNEDKIEPLIEAMYADKKVADEKLRLILLKQWGEPYIKKADNNELLKDVWQAAFGEF